MTTPRFHRRQALTGAAGLGLGLPVLAACGSEEPEPATERASGSELAATSDIPLGGGTVLDDQKLVLTQPAEGDFKAFTAVCTHQGCLVGKVEDGRILCPCHGSAFAVADGSVVEGPAEAPLAEVEITVEGDRITLA